MITLGQLEVYSRYKGDIDMFVRSGSQNEKALIDDADWNLIDVLLQDANVLDRKLGSAQRNAEAMTRLRSNCSEEVRAQIRKLAEKL